MNNNHKRLYPGLKSNTPGEKLNHLNAIVRDAKELEDEATSVFGKSAKGRLAAYLNKFFVDHEQFVDVQTLVYYKNFIIITDEIQKLVDEINDGKYAIVFDDIITEIEESHWERLAEIDKVLKAYDILQGIGEADELVALYLNTMHMNDALFFYEFSEYGKRYESNQSL